MPEATCASASGACQVSTSQPAEITSSITSTGLQHPIIATALGSQALRSGTAARQLVRPVPLQVHEQSITPGLLCGQEQPCAPGSQQGPHPEQGQAPGQLRQEVPCTPGPQQEAVQEQPCTPGLVASSSAGCVLPGTSSSGGGDSGGSGLDAENSIRFRKRSKFEALKARREEVRQKAEVSVMMSCTCASRTHCHCMPQLCVLMSVHAADAMCPEYKARMPTCIIV